MNHLYQNLASKIRKNFYGRKKQEIYSFPMLPNKFLVFFFHRNFFLFLKLNFGINDSLFMASHLYWTDTHCHLDMLEEKIVSILEEAKKKEVNRIVTIAIDKKSSKKVCDYVKSYSNVYGAVGIHPHEAKTVQQTDYDFIATSLVKEKKNYCTGRVWL